jgi:hypothetical protein
MFLHRSAKEISQQFDQIQHARYIADSTTGSKRNRNVDITSFFALIFCSYVGITIFKALKSI